MVGNSEEIDNLLDKSGQNSRPEKKGRGHKCSTDRSRDISETEKIDRGEASKKAIEDRTERISIIGVPCMTGF